MTDNKSAHVECDKTGYWQDWQDARAECEKLRETTRALWKECEPYLEEKFQGKTWAGIIKLLAEREKALIAERDQLRKFMSDTGRADLEAENAKLRTLRAKMLDCAKTWRKYETPSPSEASYWSGRRWVAEYVVERIDALLSEPETCGFPVLEQSGEVHRCDRRAGHCGAHSVTWWPQGEPRREPLPELVARLHGFVGPDGRGRP